MCEITNGEGYLKKYNDNRKLIVEGEILNGERNGKRKEYNESGELIFEGEYLYNIVLKGKEYINGKLEFEGDYLYDHK